MFYSPTMGFLRGCETSATRKARWLERLQELEFDVVHRRGRAHTNTDALSRLPCQQCGRESHITPTETKVSATTIVQSVPQQLGDNLREVQLADPVLGPLLRGKEAGHKPSQEELGSLSRSSRRLLQVWDQLVVSEGVLCRQFESPGGSLLHCKSLSLPRCEKKCSQSFTRAKLGAILGWIKRWLG
jgi:hypothetical protein